MCKKANYQIYSKPFETCRRHPNSPYKTRQMEFLRQCWQRWRKMQLIQKNSTKDIDYLYKSFISAIMRVQLDSGRSQICHCLLSNLSPCFQIYRQLRNNLASSQSPLPVLLSSCSTKNISLWSGKTS